MKLWDIFSNLKISTCLLSCSGVFNSRYMQEIGGAYVMCMGMASRSFHPDKRSRHSVIVVLGKIQDEIS